MPRPGRFFTRSGSDSHTGSTTSTIVYDHEAFDTFRSRVVNLALHKIWPDATAEEINVERMSGGGENRIIGISRQPTQGPDTHTRYILRVPRFDVDAIQIGIQADVLQILHQNGKIPVPMIVDLGETGSNELNRKYMIQHRIPGTALITSYPELSHQERCTLARELGHVFNELLAFTGVATGLLVKSDDTAQNQLLPWQCRELMWATEWRPQPIEQLETKILLPWQRTDIGQATENVPQGIDEMLIAMFTTQKHVEKMLRPDSPLGTDLFDRFCKMTSELAAEGWFTNCHISLAHLDLEPRNILVNPTSNSNLPIISAVIDWDNSLFAPQFMCCAPPMWLWAWLDNEDEDERMANEEPPTPEARQLKQLFEEAAGAEYLRFAYAPAYRLARRLFDFALHGMYYSHIFKEAEDMLDEWATIRQSEQSMASPAIQYETTATQQDDSDSHGQVESIPVTPGNNAAPRGKKWTHWTRREFSYWQKLKSYR
ncbi:hypothetical protein F4819DRAFT_470788 [Hypoxylon fuscum]|nr:hypothetical protein F4819DRAFT_470788 [Hypoxylon fuscum]